MKKIYGILLTGMFALSLAGAGTGRISASAEDREINFAGVRTETDGDFAYHNYYINENKWFIGSQITQPNYSAEEGRDYLQFTSSTDTSFFGPRAKYEDFVCRFSVIMNDVSSALGASVGISFGREQLYSGSASSPGLYFMKTDKGTAVRASGGDLDKATVGRVYLQYEEENAVDLWAVKDGRFDFMLVKTGDVARLYFAEADDEEGMKECRATLSGVSGNGYVAVSGLSGATFRLDGMSVNELPKQPSGGLETFTPEGSSAFYEEKILLGGGSRALSSELFSDAAYYCSVKVVSGSSFALNFGGSFINFSSDDSIVGRGMVTEKGGVADFDRFKEGCTVRVRAAGHSVEVDLASEDGWETVAVLYAPNALSESAYGITAGHDTCVWLEHARAVSLEGRREISTHDYDPVEDADPIREKDKSFNEYYGIEE